MRKRLFSVAALALGIVSLTSAQQTFSFEASEGFTTGSFAGQSNNWTITDLISSQAPNGHLFISNEEASQGTQSLQFLSAFASYDTYIGVATDIPPGGNIFSVSQDVYPKDLDVNSGSELRLLAYDLQGSNNSLEIPVSGVIFGYDGLIYVVTFSDPTQDFYAAEQIGEYEPGNWYNIKTTYNLTTATATYFINNNQVYTGSMLNEGTEVNRIKYLFDDYSTSYFIDNVSIPAPVANTPQHETVSFTVYPNPAQTELNIAQNGTDAIQHISITDMNGRVVKTIAPSGDAVTHANVADLSNGIYLLNVATAKGSTTKKIVKT